MGFSNSERGSAKINFILVLMAFSLVVNAGYNYLPVAYNAQAFKQEMQAAVSQGISVTPTTGTPVAVTKQRLAKSVMSHALPPDTYIEVKMVNNLLQARVYFVKKVPVLPFGAYDYTYTFDERAATNGFLQ